MLEAQWQSVPPVPLLLLAQINGQPQPVAGFDTCFGEPAALHLDGEQRLALLTPGDGDRESFQTLFPRLLSLSLAWLGPCSQSGSDAWECLLCRLCKLVASRIFSWPVLL